MRVIKQRSKHNRSHIGFNSRPFAASGVSLYVTIGNAVRYRDMRMIDGNWIRGLVFDVGQTSVPKTARVGFETSPTGEIAVAVDPDWESQTISIDIRTFRDDVENETDNYRIRQLTLDGDGEDTNVILGTATLLDYEQRDGGIVRIRFRWNPSADGVQPDKFTAIRTAGPSSPANAAVTVDPGVGLLIEIDTPVLSDASAYTYKIRASLSAVTADVLTGISITADATGPTAPTGATAEAW